MILSVFASISIALPAVSFAQMQATEINWLGADRDTIEYGRRNAEQSKRHYNLNWSGSGLDVGQQKKMGQQKMWVNHK